MPNPPKYRLYKPKGLAVVRIEGKDHYLGKHGSPESWERYHRLLAERASGADLAMKATPAAGAAVAAAAPLTVAELILAYWNHARAYYRRPDGSESAEQHNIRLALRPLRKLYGSSAAADFGPIALKAVRQSMVDSGLARTTVNQRVGKVVRAFRWAVEAELVPPSAHHALSAVAGLKAGRTEAPEPEPVRPVADVIVEATRPFLSAQVRAMVDLQRLTAMRSTEVATMRSADVDRSGDPWVYRPRSHKTAHRGHGRAVVLGPKARAIVAGWLRPDPDAFLFCPREAVEARNAAKRAGRRSPMTPSQAARRPKADPKRAAGQRYDARAYAHAIARACDRAFPHPELSAIAAKDLAPGQVAELAAWRRARRWHPHQLRHAAATAIRARYGLEAAQVVLGHSKADVTQVYAERDLARARDVMREIG